MITRLQLEIFRNEGEKQAVACSPCNPIIFQVFFSDFEDGVRVNDEARYLDFDFGDNGYGKHIAELKEMAAEEDAYYEHMNDVNTATQIDARSLTEIEKELVSLIPAIPGRAYETSYTYDHWKQGNELFHQGEFDHAIEQYEIALNLSANNDEIKFALALAYYFKADYTNAAMVAGKFVGSTHLVASFGTMRNGVYSYVLDTSPIESLNYLLEKRVAS